MITDPTQTTSGLPAPSGWHIAEYIYDEQGAKSGKLWERLTGQRITVMEDVSVKADGRTWLHVSVAKPSPKKMPTYEDLQTARVLFIGEHRESYMSFPPEERYVNANPVLHLWCCLDAPKGVLPHFERKVVIDGKELLSV